MFFLDFLLVCCHVLIVSLVVFFWGVRFYGCDYVGHMPVEMVVQT